MHIGTEEFEKGKVLTIKLEINMNNHLHLENVYGPQVNQRTERKTFWEH